MSYLFETDNLNKFKAVSEPTVLPKVVDIHIEEPELSLFPDAQCELIEGIFNTALHSEKDRTVNMMLATHSPYILNYLNILLNQTEEGMAKLTPDNLAVYRLYNGEAQNLVAKDDKGRNIVDSYDLAEMMSKIYNKFTHLCRL
jgi:predicted ATPase